MSDFENTVDIEALFATPVDMEEQEEIAKSLLLPKGDYYTLPPLTVSPHQWTNNGSTRLFVNFWGGVISNEQVGGKTGFKISNQIVYKDDGKPDLPSRLYNQVVKAYVEEVGKNPTVYGDVINFVKETPLILHIALFPASERNREPTNMVLGIGRAK